jgi:hypothetical protein
MLRIEGRGSRIERIIGTALVCFLVLSCRTGRPAGSPIAPLNATTSAEASEQLHARSAAFRGAKSLMRVRATSGGRTQSFRAQLVVHDRRRLELLAYTPVGTTALTLRAEGENISLRNHLEDKEWEGDAGELARTLGFLDSPLLPAEMAMLILGFPPGGGAQVQVAPGGIDRATAGDVVVDFEPAAFPARRVVIVRGSERVEIDHLEIVE